MKKILDNKNWIFKIKKVIRKVGVTIKELLTCKQYKKKEGWKIGGKKQVFIGLSQGFQENRKTGEFIKNVIQEIYQN